MRRQLEKRGKFASRLKPHQIKSTTETPVEKVPVILVSRQTGGIGDVLMITPTIRAIKEENPDTPLVVCLTKHYGVKGILFDVLKHNPYIDKLISVEDLINYSIKRIYNFNTGKEVSMEIDLDHPTGNRIDIFAEIVGVELKDKSLVYVVTQSEKEWAKDWIQKNIPANKRRLVGIQVGSTAMRRSWPSEKQWLLAFKLIGKYPDLSVLFFSEGPMQEMDVYQNLYQINNFPIRWVAALINECEVMVCPDSGLLHIAGALNKRIVGLFGPNPPDTRLLYYRNSVGVWMSYPCSQINCWYDRCFYNFKCMTEIPVELVMKNVVNLLEGKVERPERQKGGGTVILRMGGVGDIIALASSIQTYKDEHPDEELVFATKPQHMDVLKNAPFLKKIIPIPQTYKYFYDKVIDLRFKVESPEVGGTLDTEIYKTVNRYDVFDRQLGVVSKEKRPYVSVNPLDVEEMKSLIGYKDGVKWLGIHATCTSNTRTIPPEYIPDLVEMFSDVKKLKVVLFGNTEFWHGRKSKIDFLKIRGTRLLNIMNKTSLSEMIALCFLLDYIIGPDSSSIHVAGALRKPCIALFGNIDPYTRVFYYPTVVPMWNRSLPCIPCHDFLNPCPVSDEIGAPCMRLHTPILIFEKAKEVFKL